MIYLSYYNDSLQEKWGISCTATEEDVDVFTSGYAFRLKILHERGLGLVQRQGEKLFRLIVQHILRDLGVLRLQE